jgi:hypothetical protein
MGKKVMKGGFEFPVVAFIVFMLIVVGAIVVLALWGAGVFSPRGSSAAPPALPYGEGGSGEQNALPTIILKTAEFPDPRDITKIKVTYSTTGTCSDCSVSYSVNVDGLSQTSQTHPFLPSGIADLSVQNVHRAPAAVTNKAQLTSSTVTVMATLYSNGAMVGPTTSIPVQVPATPA